MHVEKNNEDDPEKHNDAVRDIAFSPTNEKYVTCSADKTLRISDLKNGLVEKVLEGHGSDASTVDWHPYYSLLASGGKDRYIKIWDPRQKGEICSMYNHTNSITKVRFSESGDYLLSGAKDQMVKLFEIRTMKELKSFRMHDSEVLCKFL